MATTAVEKSKTRSNLAQLAGMGPFSILSTMAGVLVGYAMFALLMAGAAAVLERRDSNIDLTGQWDTFGTRGALFLGGLLFVSYLLGGYVAGRMAWRRGWLHGLAVFVGSLVVVGGVALVVRSVAKPDDVERISDALRSFGIPTTRDEWNHVGSIVGLASLGGMGLGSLFGGMLGARWCSKVSRRALAAEIDLRERMEATDERLAPVEGGQARSEAHGNGNGRARVDAAEIDELTKEGLYELAQEFDIPGRSHMTKDELHQAVKKELRALQRQQ